MLPLDKQAHFLGGYCIGLTFGLITPALGLFLAAAAGVGKEVYDKHHPEKHTADHYDALATLLGGLVGSGVAFIFWG